MRSNENSKFTTIKKICSSKSYDEDSFRKICEEYISGLVLRGLEDRKGCISPFCAYVLGIGIHYSSECNTAQVVLIGDQHYLEVNAINIINIVTSENQIYFVLAHEVDHLLLSHLIRFYHRIQDEVSRVFMNIATDVEVNERLAETFSEVENGVPKVVFRYKDLIRMLGDTEYNVMHSISWFTGKKKKSVAEACYFLLDKKCEKTLGFNITTILYKVLLSNGALQFDNEVKKVAFGLDSILFDMKDKEEAVRFCREIAKYLENPLVVLLGVDPSNMSFDGDTVTGLSKGDLWLLMEELKDAQKSHMQNSDQNDGRGTSGGGVLIKNVFERKKTIVPWQSILKKEMKCLSTRKVPTKSRVNRRFPERLELSGRRRERVVNLVVCIDESGSINDNEYNYFISEIEAISKMIKCNLHIYEFSYGVENYTFIKSDKKGEFKKVLERCKSNRYNGGTSFQCVFNAMSENKDINGSSSVVCILTDGEGEDKVDFKGMQNRLWVITGTGKLKLSCPELESNIFKVVPM